MVDWNAVVGAFATTLATAGVVSWVVTWYVLRDLENWKYKQEEYRYFTEVIANTIATGGVISGIIDALSACEDIDNWELKPDIPPHHILGEDKIVAILLRHQEFEPLNEMSLLSFGSLTQQLIQFFDSLSHRKRSYLIETNATGKHEMKIKWGKSRTSYLYIAKEVEKNINGSLKILNTFGLKKYKEFGFEEVLIEFLPPKPLQKKSQK